MNANRALLHVREHTVLYVAVIYHDDVSGNSPHRLAQFYKNVRRDKPWASIVRHIVARIDDSSCGGRYYLPSPSVEVFVRFAFGPDDLIAWTKTYDVVSILLTPFHLMLLVEIVSGCDDKLSLERKSQPGLLRINRDGNL